MKYSLQTIFLISGVTILISVNGFFLAKYAFFSNTASLPFSSKQVQDQLARALTEARQKQDWNLRPSLAVTPSFVLQVTIKNGSGLAGAASKIKTKLDTLPNLEVSEIGNTVATPITTIHAKTHLPADIKTVILSLFDQPESIRYQEDLTDLEKTDVLIILGQN